ncbi:hypothetical protein VE03_09385 [Pseudogymnoascus sp. 23342-1-I1]|nr:hypothetical protein VE03_09385 [Pseudogymnoascus sp. 23342-1-I1]
MGSGFVDAHTITIDPTHLSQQWDKSKPLLDATCGPLKALEITLEADITTSDLKWTEDFLLCCSTLEQLSLRNKSSSFTHSFFRNPPQHQFFHDIAATAEKIPPVQALMLDSVDFTREELVRFVGRFKDTIRSLDLCRVNMNGAGGWPPFLQWLGENLPNLERFAFQGLTHDYLFVGQVVICFGWILKNPELDFKALRGAPWGSYAKMPEGTLALDACNEFTFLEKDKFFADLDKGEYKLDSRPCKNRQVYTVGFEGSNSGVREALRLLVLAAAPRDLDGPLVVIPTDINV